MHDQQDYCKKPIKHKFVHNTSIKKSNTIQRFWFDLLKPLVWVVSRIKCKYIYHPLIMKKTWLFLKQKSTDSTKAIKASFIIKINNKLNVSLATTNYPMAENSCDLITGTYLNCLSMLLVNIYLDGCFLEIWISALNHIIMQMFLQENSNQLQCKKKVNDKINQ